MAGGYRFHVDQNGHSVSVQLAHAGGEVDVLVDGKVVAHHSGSTKGTTVLTAELPGDPPRPFRVLLAPVEGADGPPLCVMESGGSRSLMPVVPLGRSAPTAPPGTTIIQALYLLRRRMRRLRRMRRMRRIRRGLRR